jgi:antitoxin (DNA-binding transcriptional repressor) of toxin-antitoxin stability system
VAVKKETSADEARTKLLELLGQVQTGKRFTIRTHGRRVADLVPSAAQAPTGPAAAITKHLAVSKGNPLRDRVDVKTLIQEGRE